MTTSVTHRNLHVGKHKQQTQVLLHRMVNVANGCYLETSTDQSVHAVAFYYLAAIQV